MRKSQIFLIIGLIVLLAGAILSILKIEPYADYTLVVGALIIILRGAIRSRERDDNANNHTEHEANND